MTKLDQYSNLKLEVEEKPETYPYEELDIEQIEAADHIEIEWPEDGGPLFNGPSVS